MMTTTISTSATAPTENQIIAVRATFPDEEEVVISVVISVSMTVLASVIMVVASVVGGAGVVVVLMLVYSTPMTLLILANAPRAHLVELPKKSKDGLLQISSWSEVKGAVILTT